MVRTKHVYYLFTRSIKLSESNYLEPLAPVIDTVIKYPIFEYLPRFQSLDLCCDKLKAPPRDYTDYVVIQEALSRRPSAGYIQFFFTKAVEGLQVECSGKQDQIPQFSDPNDHHQS